MRSPLMLTLALLGALATWGCSTHRPPHPTPRKKAGHTSETATPPADLGRPGSGPGGNGTAAPVATGGGPVVATLKGGTIDAAELAEEMVRHFPEVASAALTRLIGRRVVRREAARAGIRVPKDYLEKQAAKIYDSLVKDAAVAHGIGTSAETYVRLRFRRPLASHMAVRVREEEYRYLMNRVVRYHSIRTDRAELDVIVVKKRKVAMEVAAKLDQGADFERLARKYSTHSSSKNGGRLKPMPREALHPAAASRAFTMKEGERTGVLSVDDGAGHRQFEILRLRKLWPARRVAYVRVRDEIEKGLASEPVGREEWAAWFLWVEKLYKVELVDRFWSVEGDAARK